MGTVSLSALLKSLSEIYLGFSSLRQYAFSILINSDKSLFNVALLIYQLSSTVYRVPKIDTIISVLQINRLRKYINA